MNQPLHPNAIKPYNQKWMIENDIHPPYVNIDRTIFKKTEEEKAQLATAKARYKATKK
jgi:hypothetical protein